jgi:hypothetical protein
MRKDQQNHIILTTVIVYSAVLIFVYIMINFSGYEPKYQCANEIRRILSPYQISQMTNRRFPVSYDETANFCSNHLDDYQQLINNARSYREFADHDMF